MGERRKWRKEAKKQRRKRIRTILAKERDEKMKKQEGLLKLCPRYQAMLKERLANAELKVQEEERKANEARMRWEQNETAAQKEWRRKNLMAKQEADMRESQQAMIRLEWDKEQQKLKEEIAKIEEEERVRKAEYDRVMAIMDQFIKGEITELPAELNVTAETQPGQMICPFYEKVGACRFKNNCSRNHVTPGISKCILIPAFYTHFSLSNLSLAEYDTDISLEYENHEEQKHFLEFYEDIKEELLKFGKIDVLKVCSNEESHLRGNVYVQFQEERSAMAAFRGLNGRFYAGKRISVQFVTIPSWNRAICGLQFRRACPKGKVCNFMHVFRNPHGEFTMFDDGKSLVDKWKWSDQESDEEKGRRRKHKSHRRRSRERSRSRSKNRSRDHGNRSRHRRDRSRSRDPRKHRRKHRSPESEKDRRKSDSRRKPKHEDKPKNEGKHEDDKTLRNGS